MTARVEFFCKLLECNRLPPRIQRPSWISFAPLQPFVGGQGLFPHPLLAFSLGLTPYGPEIFFKESRGKAIYKEKVLEIWGLGSWGDP
jgi:hypothetical protein